MMKMEKRLLIKNEIEAVSEFDNLLNQGISVSDSISYVRGMTNRETFRKFQK